MAIRISISHRLIVHMLMIIRMTTRNTRLICGAPIAVGVKPSDDGQNDVSTTISVSGSHPDDHQHVHNQSMTNTTPDGHNELSTTDNPDTNTTSSPIAVGVNPLLLVIYGPVINII